MGERRQVIRAYFDIKVPRLGTRVRAVPGDVEITPL
jgi:hypothetical protein